MSRRRATREVVLKMKASRSETRSGDTPMRCVLTVLLILSFSIPVFPQGDEFQVRYNGGTIATQVKRDDWGNILKINPSGITLKLKDGQVIVIDPQKVTRLSYGRNASRRIGAYAAAAFISPLFLLGMLKKNKQHFAGIEYTDAEGKGGAVLLQLKNDHYRSALLALQGVTQKEVEKEEKEKK